MINLRQDDKLQAFSVMQLFAKLEQDKFYSNSTLIQSLTLYVPFLLLDTFQCLPFVLLFHPRLLLFSALNKTITSLAVLRSLQDLPRNLFPL